MTIMKEILRQIDFWLQEAKDEQHDSFGEQGKAFYRGEVAALTKVYILINESSNKAIEPTAKDGGS